MKHLFAIFLLFVSLNCFSQISMTAGIGGAYCFSKGNDKGVFKELLITQVNETIDKFIVSAVSTAVNDSVATGYIGTGISYLAWFKDNQALLIGLNILKGEKKNAITGGGLTYVQNKTLLGLHYQKDLSKGKDWIAFTIQRFVF